MANLKDSQLTQYSIDVASRCTKFRDRIRSSNDWNALEQPLVDELATDFCEHIVQPFLNEIKVNILAFCKAVIASHPQNPGPQRVHHLSSNEDSKVIKAIKGKLDDRWPAFMESFDKHQGRNQEFKTPIFDTYLFDEFYELLESAGIHFSSSKVFPVEFIETFKLAVQNLTIMIDHLPGMLPQVS